MEGLLVLVRDDVAVVADRVRAHFADACYACGRSNPVGLRIDAFSVSDGEVAAEFRPRAEFRGGPGVLHGGVTATALDEIMAWAGVLTLRVVSVTATMSIRFTRPVPLDGHPLRLRGRVEDRRGRRLSMRGTLVAGDDVCAESTGVYVVRHSLEDLLASPI
jgi:acyl-coenzyme A thioesterase PaaI-like protein